MDVLLPFFQLLYFVAHFLVSLALSVYDTFRDLHRLLLWLYSYLRPIGISAYRLQCDAALLKKIPEHLAIVVIGRQVNNIAHLITVISWCAAYGVKHISLYDTRGVLKQSKGSVVKELESKNTGVRFNIVSNNFNSYQLKDIIPVISNNDSRLPVVTVNLLSLEDGRGDLVRVTRNMCGCATLVDQDAVDCQLLTKGQPDPEVVITVGEPMTTLGFFPWQIRLSEFFEVPSLSRFEYNEFRTIFQRYSRCEQRFGK